MREVNHANLFTIEVDRQRLIERDHRKSLFGRSGSRCLKEFRSLFSRKAFPNVVMRNDWSVASERGIASRVISMPMSIKDKLQFTVAKILKCSFDFVG